MNISVDNQIFASSRSENLGIFNHYQILIRQIASIDSNLNISLPRFIHRSKNLVPATFLISWLATFVRRWKQGIFWALARKESSILSEKSNYIFTTFYYSSWFDLYAGSDSLKKMIVCNHDCIIENLHGSQVAISAEGQSKSAFILGSKAVYVPSIWTFNQTKKYYPDVKEKLFLIPHFIEYSKDQIHKSVQIRFRDYEAKDSDNQLRLLHVGGLEGYKNFNLIFKMLMESNFQIEMTLLGAGATEQYLSEIRLLRASGHRLRIIPFASEDEKNLEYSKADALLIPSLDEGFSFPTYEAAIHGLPIIKYSKNPWGFSGLTIANDFNVKTIAQKLDSYYKNSSAGDVTSRIIRELESNNDSSVRGLKELLEFLLESIE
jgi:glycosyltransferase involved in cell wall biosynthesis